MEMVMKACEGRSESGLCKVIGVSRDKKGKALLVMQLMKGDLRNLIDSRKDFVHNRKREIMLGIARGLKNLHACGRIHKDVKASNILVNTRESEPIPAPPTGNERLRWQVSPGDYGFHRTRRGPGDSRWDRLPFLPQFDDLGREISYFRNTYVDVYIGDYESVDGVFGTGFWRPPEVLKALRNGSPEDLKLTYLPAGDVYGFGMVLYEVLTGRIPFQGHSLNDYDLVISGARPDIPDDVSPEMRDLLLRCWHQDPHQRPSWTEIEKYF
jgi:serine/threonine protein kinase